MSVSEMEAMGCESAGAILGVAVSADESEIRAAYLSKVKQHPPERCPEEFQRVRAAYDLLRSPRERTRRRFLAMNPERPLSELLETTTPVRKFLGPQAWIQAMKGK